MINEIRDKEGAKVLESCLRKFAGTIDEGLAKEAKARLREYYHRPTEQGRYESLMDFLKNGLETEEVEIVTDDTDWVKVSTSQYKASDEELHERFNECQIYSPYDCTGRPFMWMINQHYSTYLKKWVVVERWGLDV